MVESTGSQAGETQPSKESSSNETVLIPDASNEELQAFLEDGPEEVETESEDEGEGYEPDDDDDDLQNNTAEPQVQTDSNQQEESTLEAQNKALQERNKKLTEQIKQTELYVQHRNNEIGKLRLERQGLIQQLTEGLQDKFADNPSEAMEDKLAIEQLKAEDAELQLEAENNQRVMMGQKFLSERLAPEDLDLEAMGAALQEVGSNPQYVAAFKSNPLSVATPTEVLLLAKQVKAEKQKATLYYYLQRLWQDHQKLRSSSKAKPKQLLSDIQRTLREDPPMTRSQTRKRTAGGFSKRDLPNLSSEQLQAILNDEA